MQKRVFFLQKHELGENYARVCIRRENDAVAHHAFKRRTVHVPFLSQALAGVGFRKPQKRAHLARRDLIGRIELQAAVYSNLGNLLLARFPVRVIVFQRRAHIERAARELDKGHATVLRVTRDFENARGKLGGVGFIEGIGIERTDERFNAVELQARAEKAGKERPIGCKFCKKRVRKAPGAVIFVHSAIGCERHGFIARRNILRKINTHIAEAGCERS